MIGIETIARILGILVFACYVILTLFQLKRFFTTSLCKPLRSVEAARGKWEIPFLAFAASRLFIVAVVLAAAAVMGETQSLLANWKSYINRWDGPHYIKLIENGYVSTGDDSLFIVFFPLYPMICRLFAWTGLSAFARALIVSNLACCANAYLLYALVLCEGSEERARLATILLMFNPVSFFMSMPYTESIFILFTISAVLLARKRKFIPAVIVGAFAATARMVGLAVAAPIFWEMLRAKREKSEHLKARDILLCVLQTLPMLLGIGAYLLLNQHLFGNPLEFMKVQSEHWGNRIVPLSETIRYVFINAVQYEKVIYRIGTWIPELIAIISAIVLSAVTLKKQHPGDAAFLAIALCLSVSISWLLSGVRYVTAFYAIYPMLALLPKRRRTGGIMVCISMLLLVYMTVLGINFGYVL